MVQGWRRPHHSTLGWWSWRLFLLLDCKGLQGFVAIKWDILTVVGYYVTLNCSPAVYEACLDLEGVFRVPYLSWVTLTITSEHGDQPADSQLVDLSGASTSAMRMVSGSKVAEKKVTLSDHGHIIFDVALEELLIIVHGRISAHVSFAIRYTICSIRHWIS